MPGEGPETISNDPRAEYRAHCAFRAGPAAGVEPRRKTSPARQRRPDCATEIAGPRDRTVCYVREPEPEGGVQCPALPCQKVFRFTAPSMISYGHGTGRHPC